LHAVTRAARFERSLSLPPLAESLSWKDGRCQLEPSPARGILVSMIVRPEAPPLTVEHYRNLPETGPRYQLIEGDLYMAPAPNRYHQDISRNLEFILLNYLKDHPVGVLYHAPFDVYLSETDVFQPDIVVVLKANFGLLTDAGCEGAPDFVVEILSPKTRRLDLDNKKRVYNRHGVKELWIIDPEPRELLVYRFERGAGETAELFHQSDIVTSPLLPRLAVALEEAFHH
jgi:Uma2 family endonuclease